MIDLSAPTTFSDVPMGALLSSVALDDPDVYVVRLLGGVTLPPAPFLVYVGSGGSREVDFCRSYVTSVVTEGTETFTRVALTVRRDYIEGLKVEHAASDPVGVVGLGGTVSALQSQAVKIQKFKSLAYLEDLVAALVGPSDTFIPNLWSSTSLEVSPTDPPSSRVVIGAGGVVARNKDTRLSKVFLVGPDTVYTVSPVFPSTGVAGACLIYVDVSGSLSIAYGAVEPSPSDLCQRLALVVLDGNSGVIVAGNITDRRRS